MGADTAKINRKGLVYHTCMKLAWFMHYDHGFKEAGKLGNMLEHRLRCMGGTEQYEALTEKAWVLLHDEFERDFNPIIMIDTLLIEYANPAMLKWMGDLVDRLPAEQAFRPTHEITDRCKELFDKVVFDYYKEVKRGLH